MKRNHNPRSRVQFKRIGLLGVNIVVFYFLFKWVKTNVRPAVLASQLGDLPLWVIPEIFFFNLISLVLSGVRMGLLLGRRFPVSFAVNVIGDGLNTAMPLRLGEAAKLYYGRRFYSVPVSVLLASTVTIELFEAFFQIMFGVAVILFVSQRFINISSLLPVLVPVVLTLSAILLINAYFVPFIRIFPKKTGLRQTFVKLRRHVARFSPRRILLVTAAIWTSDMFLIYFTFTSTLRSIHFGFRDAISLLLILNVASTLPSAPAGFGLVEAGIVAYLTYQFHIGAERALATGMFFHLMNSLPQLAFAGWLVLSKKWGGRYEGALSS